MKAKKREIMLMVLVTLIPTVWTVVQDGDKPSETVPPFKYTVVDEGDTLRGLQEVKVATEDLRLGVERLGLTRQTAYSLAKKCMTVELGRGTTA